MNIFESRARTSLTGTALPSEAIEDVETAVRLAKAEFKRWREQVRDFRQPWYGHNLGIWYRGESGEFGETKLVPSVFRKSDARVPDEVSMFHHFQLQSSRYRSSHHTALDWLSLMQHYNLPTRLLDWTENPLIALYFAVNDVEFAKEDGFLYVLDARALNEATDLTRTPALGIHVAESFNAVIRAETARRSNLMSLLGCNAVRHCDEIDAYAKRGLLRMHEQLLDIEGQDEHVDIGSLLEDTSLPPGVLARMCMPTAIFPYRNNPRMNAQYSLFTLHGGQARFEPQRSTGAKLGLPRKITEATHADGETPVVWRYLIGSERKESIKGELAMIGIHEATLFPELDRQARHTRQQWLIGGEV